MSAWICLGQKTGAQDLSWDNCKWTPSSPLNELQDIHRESVKLQEGTIHDCQGQMFPVFQWQAQLGCEALGMPKGRAPGKEGARTHYRCIRETMVLKAACTSAAEHVHTTGSVCFCRTSERN